MESRAKSTHISGFVLAGGRSGRLGQDKVLLPWNRRPLLTHAVERLRQVCETVRICTDRKDLGDAAAQSDGLISDAVPAAGPLGGIVAALEQSETLWNLFLAVDLPLVPVEFLQMLVEAVADRQPAHSGMLCLIPQIDGRPQPLCGLYHRNLASGLRQGLEAGKYKLMLALHDAVQNVSPAIDASLSEDPASRLKLFDVQNFPSVAELVLPPADWFLNINTPEDWAQALRLQADKGSG